MVCTLQQVNCCCCCPLRTGTWFISICLCFVTVAYLFAFFPVVNLIYPYVFADYPSDIKQIEHLCTKLDSVTFYPRIAYTIVNLLTVILLFVALIKRNRTFILPWLICMCINCICGTIGTIGILVLIIFFFANLTLKLIFTIIFFIALLITTIWWYSFLCVWSFYKALQEDEFELKQPLQSPI